MAINESSGYIGLGSRLFLSKETTWGTKENAWEVYNIYNQEGGRPQKVTTPIEVSQLYPSMLRRKPIQNSTSIEGGFTFSLPVSNFDPFAELITGDVISGGTALPITIDITSEGDADRLMFTLATDYTVPSAGNALISALIGKTITISGVGTNASEGEDDLELSFINRDHVVLFHDHDGINTEETGNPGLGNASKVVVETSFDITQLTGVINTTGTLGFGGDWDLQQVVSTSYSFAQTISTKQIALYTGMMAQSTTFNVSPDDVANCEITFLGKDETLYAPTDVDVTSVFGNASTHIQTNNAGEILDVGSGYDNVQDFYPSWSTTLYINRKSPEVAGKYQIPTDDGWGTDENSFILSALSAVPFSDLSITINNNLEFPAYLNGTKTRNKPVQTTYKEVTGSITIPYNEYTDYIVASMFDQDSFEFRVVFSIDGAVMTLTLPEVCITGDSLADIPAGEMTLPINFSAYASKDASGTTFSQSISPFTLHIA